jgi:hypothetical protein
MAQQLAEASLVEVARLHGTRRAAQRSQCERFERLIAQHNRDLLRLENDLHTEFEHTEDGGQRVPTHIVKGVGMCTAADSAK